MTDQCKLFKEYYKIKDILETQDSIIVLGITLETLGAFKEQLKSKDNIEPNINDINRRIEEFCSQITDVSFDVEKYKSLLKKVKKESLEFGKRPAAFKEAESFLLNHLQIIENKISEIPNSISKAKDNLKFLIESDLLFRLDSLLDAIIFFKEDLTKNIIDQIYQEWKDEQNKHKEYSNKHGIPITKKTFWSSPDNYEILDDISRYRVYETFEFTEFREVFKEVERELEDYYILNSLSCDPIYLWHLWLLSRSKGLRNKYRQMIDLVCLKDVMEGQSIDGCFVNPYIDKDDPRNNQINVFHTALASLCVLRFSANEILTEKALKGIDWLIENQHKDGFWEDSIHNSVDNKLTNTILALEAIIISRKKANRCIESGINWLLTQQNDVGLWEGWYFDSLFWTVLILELIELNKFKPITLTPFASLGVDYLNKSIELLSNNTNNSYRMALTTAFQGIEFFIYALLETKNETIYENNNINKSIGMKKALDSFEKLLQSENILAKNQPIFFKSSLMRVKYLRDEVIHKGIAIDETECKHLVNEAISFTSKYSKEIFGFDVFS